MATPNDLGSTYSFMGPLLSDVLVELLNLFSECGEKARRGAVAHAEGILSSAKIEVTPESHNAFIAGHTLYKPRPDKG